VSGIASSAFGFLATSESRLPRRFAFAQLLATLAFLDPAKAGLIRELQELLAT
jgi:hypothetical protein